MPPGVVQKEDNCAAEAEKLWGTTKAAQLVDCQDCPNLLVASVYDTKLVHLLSTASECVEWTVTKKKVWSERAKKKTDVSFFLFEYD